MQLADTHAHIHFADYGLDPDQVLIDASEAGVTKVICVGCSLADSQRAVDFVNNRPGTWAAVGAHPHDGADYLTDKNADTKLADLLKQPKVVAVGEIGLDYHYDNTDRDAQKQAFRRQLEIGLESGLPFIFHVREAFDDFWEIFDSYKGSRITGVVHSFSAHRKELGQILERDLYVGLNGIMTFTKDEEQLDAAKAVPANKLLLETDAPFLTPIPYRGKICESKHVVSTAEFLANLRMTTLEALASDTSRNASDLFSLA